jgi:hypothetical protein
MISAADMNQTLQTQEELNLALLDAIVGLQAIGPLLDKGAQVNTVGIPSFYDEDSVRAVTPLAWAVQVGSITAVERLLARGANTRGLTISGAEIIGTALTKGDHRIVDALLKADKNLLDLLFNTSDLHGQNHLHHALFSMSPWSVIQDGVWESPEIRKLLIEYWHTVNTVEIPDRPLTVQYSGNSDMLTILLNHRPDMALMKTDEGISPWDIVSNPRAYQQYFFDVNGDETIRCLTAPDDPNPNVLSFQIDLSDRHGSRRFSEKDPDYGMNRPLVTVVFDFTKLQNLIRRYVQNLPAFHLIEQAQQQSKQMLAVQQQLMADQRQLQTLLNPQEEQARFNAWLAKPGHENLALFHGFIHGKIERIMISFMAADGPALDVKQGNQLQSLRTVLGVLGNTVSLVPLIGHTARPKQALNCFLKQPISLLKNASRTW